MDFLLLFSLGERIIYIMGLIQKSIWLNHSSAASQIKNEHNKRIK